MKAKEFTKPLEEKEIVEIVPAIAATVGRVGAQMGSAAAKAGAKMGTQAMKMGAKTGANLAKGIGKQAVNSIAKAQSSIAKSILKKGNTLTLPQQGGSGEAEFDIDDVSGDSVVLKNPKPKPGEPNAFVYSKKDLDQVVKSKADQAVNTPQAKKVV